MRKTFFTLALSTMAFLASSSGTAQNAHHLPKPERMRVKPLLTSLMPVSKTVSRGIVRGPVRPVEANVTLWGNLRVDGEWGYYAFAPTSPMTFTPLGKMAQRVGKNGVQVADGKLYAVDFSRYGVGSGELTLYTYDTDTWEGSSKSYDDFSLAALETAQASDGTVYGEFYNSVASNKQYELGTVDYRTCKRTTFGTTTRRYVAMGVTSAGLLYGIAADGNLYQISTSDGTETLVGPTGVGLVDDWGGPYDQTGEIDPKSDTFYWYAQDYDYNTALYTVDLTTGAATKIADANYTVYGMLVAPAKTSSDVPAAATDVTAHFKDTSLSGMVTFTAPATLSDGAALTGTLTYIVTANGEQVAEGTVQAGASASAQVTVTHSGDYTFAVTVANGTGSSKASSVKQWVGFDEPVAVGNPSATLSGDRVTVSWTAPAEGSHQGTLGPLTYDVVRIQGRDTVSVAKGLSDTSCVDNVSSAQLGAYTYAVRAISGDVAGRWANTAAVVAGAALEPDWCYEFEGASALSLFRVVDANADHYTWWCNGMRGYGAMSNQSRAAASSDDWLITPPIHVTTDRVYTLSFKARNMMDSPRNTMEVCWGDGNSPSQLTHTLLPTFTPYFSETNGQWQVCTVDLIPDKDGNVYIGFHDNTSAADKYQIAIDSITVTKTAYTASPDSVRSLTVTPAPEGDLSATLSFMVPDKTLNGKTLTRVDSFSVVRDGLWTACIAGAEAGKQVIWKDNTLTANGFRTYTVIPYCGGHPGRVASVRAFVGRDRPKNPSGVAFADQGDHLLATWDSFSETGANGGFLYPEEVSVSFFSLVNGDFGYEVGDSLTTSQPGETSVTVPFDPNVTTMADGKTQTLAWFAVRANAEGGQSDYVTARGVVIGPNIQLPFKESLKGGQLDNGFASLLGNEQYNSRSTAASWRVVTDNASDNDGGSLAWANYTEDYAGTEVAFTIQEGDATSVNMPKVTLQGASKPKLFFDVYSLMGNEATLQVLVQTPDGVDHQVAEYDLATTETNGWARHAVDLSSFTGERYVIVKFNGIAKGSKVLVGVDNVNIMELHDRNLAATDISVPENIVAGKTGSVDVTVQNLGTETVDGYRVVLYADGQSCDTVSVNRQLASLGVDTVRLSLPVAINEKASQLSVKATVVCAGDEWADDDDTPLKNVSVTPSAYGRIDDLQAVPADNGTVSLTWGSPVLPEPERVTDGFEEYAPFATQMSPWTLVDGDKGAAGALQQSATYPGQGEPFAFTAFNPDWWMEDMTSVNPGLAPHSGNQYAAAVYAYDADRKFVAQNNWMISPRLSGRKQKVSFYVMNIATYTGDKSYAESFDVLYSTADADTASFVKIESDKADGTVAFNDGANWKLVTVELPEGTRYFAIHHNTPRGGSYVFGIDDVNYETLAVGADDEVTAYIVYRDGQPVARLTGDTHTYADDRSGVGDHIYNVTVVYTSAAGDVNESGFSNDASVTVTGISPVGVDNSYNVTTLGGVRMRSSAKSLDGLRRNVYIINGKKQVVK